MRLKQFSSLLVASMALCLTVGCSDGSPEVRPVGDHGHSHDHDHDHHDHAHEAPHGGTLVEIGDHFAHLEFVLDGDANKLTIYVLDGGAENPVRIGQESITMTIKPDDGEAFTLVANAVANTLTGETVGDSSQFEGMSESLDGLEHFDVVIETITVRGSKVDGLAFPFPEGNEVEHEDH